MCRLQGNAVSVFSLKPCQRACVRVHLKHGLLTMGTVTQILHDVTVVESRRHVLPHSTLTLPVKFLLQCGRAAVAPIKAKNLSGMAPHFLNQEHRLQHLNGLQRDNPMAPLTVLLTPAMPGAHHRIPKARSLAPASATLMHITVRSSKTARGASALPARKHCSFFLQPHRRACAPQTGAVDRGEPQ